MDSSADSTPFCYFPYSNLTPLPSNPWPMQRSPLHSVRSFSLLHSPSYQETQANGGFQLLPNQAKKDANPCFAHERESPASLKIHVSLLPAQLALKSAAETRLAQDGRKKMLLISDSKRASFQVFFFLFGYLYIDITAICEPPWGSPMR